jgi:hypothetical protein
MVGMRRGVVDQNELVALMAQIAAGDAAAIFELKEVAGDALAGALRSLLAARGVRRIDTAELDGLVIDACLALGEVAGAWNPEGGASPWRWARFRLASVVDTYLGQHADEWDDRHTRHATVPAPAATNEPAPWVVLTRLATRNDRCAVLAGALETVASERDRSVYLEFQLQQFLGDPSPAVTVGAMFGLRPDAVRQVVRRVRTRLDNRGDTSDELVA